ncbi:Hypothetical predicted protein [Pelobates cultripes]|uniref:Uncharacterized protein n=1 Tax=Pelobates cultripes TaxID=61616 RepID=A0AAD1SAP5_PELCU|nr:Hypothetical predicted protein [Pelobates cultripes]
MAETADPQSSSSEEEALDAPDPIQQTADPLSTLGDLGTSDTKGDIQKNLRTMFRKDIEVLQEEVTTVTDRVRATEEDITSIAPCQQVKGEKLQHLQSLHQTLEARMDGLDDGRRCTNIKIRGIAESIDDT